VDVDTRDVTETAAARRPAGRRRHGLVWILLVLLVLQGVGGIFGGAALVLSPSGDLLQMPTSYLDGSPFSDYLIPGLLLLTVLGVFPLVVAAGLWRRRPWAWFGAFAIGCALVIFEIVEYAMIGSDPQQAVWGSIGVLIAACCIAPSVQRYSGVWWGRRT
jgi:hypothetical protein